jgi:hypothetical protein
MEKDRERSPDEANFLSNDGRSSALVNSKLRRLSQPENGSSPGPGQASVANLRIKTHWLLNNINYEYQVILKQAFLFAMAENDLQIALQNFFPQELVRDLQASLAKIQSVPYYESLVTSTLENRIKFLDQFYLHTKTHFVQISDKGLESDFLKLSISTKGIFYTEKELLSNQKYEFKLINVAVQNKPIYPRLHKKLFLGTLAWLPPAPNADHAHRILLKIKSPSDEVKDQAIYFKSLVDLQKVKNIFLIHSKKALFSDKFLKFLAVI